MRRSFAACVKTWKAHKTRAACTCCSPASIAAQRDTSPRTSLQRSLIGSWHRLILLLMDTIMVVQAVVGRAGVGRWGHVADASHGEERCLMLWSSRVHVTM